MSQDGSPLLEIERLPDDRMERLLLRPDDDGTRVRRGLLALEEIYSPRRAPLTVSNKNELYTRIAEMIGDVPLTYFEFGVWRGASIKLMAQKFRHAEARFIGFDSFEGLPEKWDPNNDVGQFSTNGATPAVEDSRISFRKGWFQNTVAGVCGGLDHRSGPTLIHFDADLYSSTLYLLTCLSSYFKEYYFLFDEFFPDEVNALREFALAYPIAISFDAAILSNDNRPVQLFGRMKRVPFALDVAPVHAGLEV